MARLFGTDGVRGVANAELTPELAFKLGFAAATYFGREVVGPKIIIGRDTRRSGQMLEAALAAGICAAGGNAHLLGVMPTPAISYLTSEIKANAGVVISASHNPFEDNGIKFFSQTGHKLPDSVEDEIEEIYEIDYDDDDFFDEEEYNWIIICICFARYNLHHNFFVGFSYFAAVVDVKGLLTKREVLLDVTKVSKFEELLTIVWMNLTLLGESLEPQ